MEPTAGTISGGELIGTLPHTTGRWQIKFYRGRLWFFTHDHPPLVIMAKTLLTPKEGGLEIYNGEDERA